MLIKATICALLDNEGEAKIAETWLQENASSLTFVSEMNGCGCCVLSWDIEGPEAVVETLPKHLSASSSWASGGNT